MTDQDITNAHKLRATAENGKQLLEQLYQEFVDTFDDEEEEETKQEEGQQQTLTTASRISNQPQAAPESAEGDDSIPWDQLEMKPISWEWSDVDGLPASQQELAEKTNSKQMDIQVLR